MARTLGAKNLSPREIETAAKYMMKIAKLKRQLAAAKAAAGK